MAFTFAYLDCNGVAVTAGDTYALVVNVYQMNANYTYDQIVTNQAVARDATYNIVYTEDGVYKIVITEQAVVDTEYKYSDINYCSFLSDYGLLLKELLCCDEECTKVNLNNSINLGIIAFRFLAQNTYTPAAVTDFTDAAVISELQKNYDSIARTSKYILLLNNDGSCCTN